MPAQLKSTSTSPASRATLAMADSSVTSSTRARMPCFPSRSESAAAFMSVAQTCAPSRANASAAARPIPCAAAVTNATLPCRRPAMRAAIILRVTVNQLDFAGRTAVVTGGAQGIGAAIVERLRSSGARVQIWELDGTPPADVSDPASVDEALKHALKELGKIDVLVNNAGIAGQNVPTVEYPIQEWERVLRVNLTSQFLCCRAVAPHMAGAGYGRIVNIASVAGKEGNPNAVAYSASKAGVISLTKSLGKELAATNIRVNCLTPGSVRPPILEQLSSQHIEYMVSKIPMQRFGTIEEIAAMACFVASREC